MERTKISKKIRFEVFKRDKFTCQYCGRKAPDVVLNIDHITPVSKGGTNDILNLITSCFECNNGKSNTSLSDDSAITKQRLQLEQIQERREQIEMMFEWKKSIEHLDTYTSDLLIQYVESKITPFTLNDDGKRKLSNLLKKFDVSDLFDAIDQGVKSCLKYDLTGQLTEESVETFVNKIGSFAAYQKMSPVDQKMHYIKGICRNRFHYWDDKTGLAILRQYIDALRKHGWSEEQIIKDLETEACDVAKKAKNWSEWRQTMEGWTQEIRGWGKDVPNTPYSVEHELELNEIEEISKEIVCEISGVLDLISFMTAPFTGSQFERQTALRAIQNYINIQIDTIIKSGDLASLEPNYQICRKMHLFDSVKMIDSELTRMINEMLTEYISNYATDWFYLPSYGINKAKDAMIFKKYFDHDISTVS